LAEQRERHAAGRRYDHQLSLGHFLQVWFTLAPRPPIKSFLLSATPLLQSSYWKDRQGSHHRLVAHCHEEAFGKEGLLIREKESQKLKEFGVLLAFICTVVTIVAHVEQWTPFEAFYWLPLAACRPAGCWLLAVALMMAWC
jgi:hypothetical protein